MTSGRPALQARGLTWTPLGSGASILDGVDLRIEQGERVLLVGASGAGKSTLLRGLAGVLGEAEAGALAGEVLVDGTTLVAGDGRVGLLLQDPVASRVAGRVGRDVAFGAENLGIPRAEIHARVADALAAVGFPYGPEHRTAATSGGEAQRLALAGVLVMHPQVLLLDEPTAMLDEDSATDVRSAVAEVVGDRRVSLVVVEHRLDRWLLDRDGTPAGLIDRLVVLGDRGAIVADGPPDRVIGTHRETLLDAGIWLPGEPAPQPRCLDVPGPRRLVDGQLLTFSGVGLTRAARRGLSVARREPPVVALAGVDLTIDGAAMTVLRGRSGAGKSSLLSLAVGLERATSGDVTCSSGLAGSAPTDPGRWTSRELAERAAWVPQQASLAVVAHTVRECLLATSRALRLDDAETSSPAEALAAALDLDGLMDRNPHTLSGGQLRRLALASALVHGPAVLALDEPSVGQDRHTWAAVAGVCDAAVRAGAAVVVSTHDDDLARAADVTHVLDGGRLVGAGR